MAHTQREREEVKPNTYYIPKNSFDTGYVFNGQFRTRNFVEAAVLALPVLAIFINGWVNLGWDIQKTAAIAIILTAVVFILVVIGVDGDSLFEFIGRVVRFRKNKKVCKYNPRIKSELEPGYLLYDEGFFASRNFKHILKNLEKKIIGANDEKVNSDLSDKRLRFYYDDDDDFVEKPNELKTAAELKAEAKARKKAEQAYINSLPREQRAEARAELKRKREEEAEAAKQRKLEQEAIVKEAIDKRIEKAERVKTRMYYEKIATKNESELVVNAFDNDVYPTISDDDVFDDSADSASDNEIEAVFDDEPETNEIDILED